MLTTVEIRTVSKMRKGELISWLEAHGMFSLIAGWHDHSKDELVNEVLGVMDREQPPYVLQHGEVS